MNSELRNKAQVIVRKHLAKGKSLKCHHKNCNDKEFHSLESYNNHCHSRHTKQPMYPELPLIKMLEHEPKGNPWENNEKDGFRKLMLRTNVFIQH